MDRYPEKRDLFSGVLSVPGGRYIVEDNRRKFVAGWADFNGNRDICRNNICAHRRRDRSRRRSPYNSNGVCDDSRRADRNTFCCAFAVWDYSGIQLLVLKKQRDIEIPFVPFLLAGYLGGVFL